jgi:hypothetical protein
MTYSGPYTARPERNQQTPGLSLGYGVVLEPAGSVVTHVTTLVTKFNSNPTETRRIWYRSL